MITLPRCSFRTSLSGVVSEGVAEVETYPKADRNRNRGGQQNLCWCHVLVSPCPPENGEERGSGVSPLVRMSPPLQQTRARTDARIINPKRKKIDIVWPRENKRRAPTLILLVGTRLGGAKKIIYSVAKKVYFEIESE